MKNFNISIEFCRNVGISAHIDAGKTTTTERILYYSGLSYKIGEVHEGEAVMDWMDQEQERGITITSASTTIFWNGMNNNLPVHRINIIDTPGHVDFTVEVERSMRVMDSVCMVYCGVAGVQSQSEAVWRQADKYNIPRLIFVNKMDRVGADFFKVYDQVKKVLNATPVPIYLPYYDKDNFSGLIDLLKFKLIVWDDNTKGKTYNYKDIPDNFLEISNFWRDKLIELSLDGFDDMLEKYINNTLSNLDIIYCLRKKTISCQIQPMICGSSFKNKGVQCILDSILQFLPSPLDSGDIKGSFNDIDIFRKPCSSDYFCALVFKIMSDPFVGQLAFFRVYSGIVSVGDLVLNSTKNKKERLGRILQMHANNRSDIKSVSAGNVAAAIGLKTVFTGDTICDFNNPIILEKIDFPEPVISQYLEVCDKSDQEKLNLILNKISHEDPSFKYYIDPDSDQTIISGMGELHLEVLTERIKRENNLNLITGKPKVSYKETIKLHVKNIEGKYIRQSGGRGQYGHVVIDVKPNTKGCGFQFIDNIKGGVIPKEYISSIEKGIKESLKSGILAGYPVIDIVVFLVYGSYHDVDSSENAFKIAASIALKDALKKAFSVLLEPIMSLNVEIPDLYMGNVISDISSKRGILLGIDDISNNFKIIKCTIPLSETFGYSTALRSMTQGRGVFNMTFNCYSEVPKSICESLILK